MGKTNRSREKGISLLLSMLALMLMTAVVVGMVYMSSTETWVSSNFKASETAYFAARAGVEEVRDRMLPAHPNTIAALLPTTQAGTPNGVLYILQPGVTMANVMDMSDTNPLRDSDLCHGWGYPTSRAGMTAQPPNVPCTDLPSVAGWYRTATSVAPFANSSNPMEYKWVRVTLKENDSAPFWVDTTIGMTGAEQACWNGTSEVVNPVWGACDSLFPKANPVFLVTALAVTQSGARRLVQQEISQTPLDSFPYGAFATGTGCGALTLGGGARTFSFNSATQNPPTNPPSNISLTGGNVGSNGNLSFNGSGTTVNGTTGSAVAGIGNCNQGNGITASGGANFGTPSLIPAQSLPVPPMPNPLPPTRAQNINNSQTLPPGAYGNLNIQGGSTVTLQGGTATNPAVYTLNSISLAGGSTLIINGPVVLNIAGVGQQNPVNFTGGSFQNNTFIPGYFVINYGGNNNISLNGGSAAYAVINAPNANISFSGGSNFYGQAIGRTISDTGGTNFYYDTSLNTPGPNNNAFYEISMRELTY
jgi:hypothetical protein